MGRAVNTSIRGVFISLCMAFSLTSSLMLTACSKKEPPVEVPDVEPVTKEQAEQIDKQTYIRKAVDRLNELEETIHAFRARAEAAQGPIKDSMMAASEDMLDKLDVADAELDLIRSKSEEEWRSDMDNVERSILAVKASCEEGVAAFE